MIVPKCRDREEVCRVLLYRLWQRKVYVGALSIHPKAYFSYALRDARRKEMLLVIGGRE